MRATEQLTLWDFNKYRLAVLNNELNKLGPYRLPDMTDVHRHPDCENYAGCLGYAAMQNWPSFSCQRCRKTVGGVFE